MHLWMTTRVPMTRANVQFYTGASRAQVERFLDTLVAANVLDLDSDATGELLYQLRGAVRPASGLAEVAQVVKKHSLEAEVKSLIPTRRSAAAVALSGPSDRSVIASAALSFFFGPVGWLYAAPLGTAIKGAGAFVLLYAILPHFLFTPLLALLLPASAAAGAYFAWSRKG